LSYPTYDAVELAAFVALRAPEVVLGLTGAELAEILGGLGDDISKELELDPSEGLSYAALVDGDGGGRYHVITRTGSRKHRGKKLRTSQGDIEEDPELEVSNWAGRGGEGRS
jgi:hypothetical protein